MAKKSLIFVLIVLSLIAAACGGDDSGDDNAGDTTGTTDTTTAPEDDGGDIFGDGGDEAEDDTDDSADGGEDDSTSTLPDEVPEATEIGITDSQIRIGILADVENPFRPGLAQGNVDGINAWAHYVNEELGGIAGREVVIDFYDTKLDISGAAFPAAVSEACSNNFAIVGSWTLFDGDVAGLPDCADMAGEPTGLPDLSVVSGEPAKYTNPTTFDILPNEQTSGTARTGDVQWLLDNVEGCCDMVGILPNDTPAALELSKWTRAGWAASGVNILELFEVSGLETNYDPFTQAIIDQDANMASSNLDVNSTVVWRQNVATLAPDLDVTWHCTQQCYGDGLFAEGADVVEGTYVSTLALPVEEEDQNPLIGEYLAGLDATGGKIDGLGFQAFAQGIIFQEVVDKILAEDQTINSLTRERFLDVMSDHVTDAHGLIGETRIGEQISSGCFILLQAQGGEFVRIYPEEPGTFDCEPTNTVDMTAYADDPTKSAEEASEETGE